MTTILKITGVKKITNFKKGEVLLGNEDIPVNSRIMCRDGSETAEIAQQPTTCYLRDKILPGQKMYLFGTKYYCENHFFMEPTVESVKAKFSGKNFNVIIDEIK
jgi:hypothetical protein